MSRKQKIQETSRDKRLIEFLMNPMTFSMLFALGLFSWKQALYRRLRALCLAKRIVVTGYVSNGKERGCPSNVYATQMFHQDTLESHELPLSRILLDWGLPCLRGKFVNPVTQPDAMIGQLNVEYDTGSMDLTRLETRARKYLKVNDPVVWITPRPAQVLEACGCISDRVFVSNGSELFSDFDGETILLKELAEMLSKEALTPSDECVV